MEEEAPATPPHAVVPAPLNFSASEWTALFPAAGEPGQLPLPGPEAPPLAVLSPPAPASADHSVLDAQTAIAVLVRTSPALGRALRAQLVAGRLAKRFFAGLTAVVLLLQLSTWAVVGVYGGGIFTSQALAFGAAAMVVASCYAVSTVLRSRYTRQFVHRGLDGHPVAELVRWQEALEERERERGDSKSAPAADAWALLDHDANDDACPCSSASCAGRTASRAAVLRWADFVIRFLWMGFTWCVAPTWTALVTLRSSTWTSLWAALLCVLAVVLGLLLVLVILLGRFADNLPLLRLSYRLRHRAMVLALADVIRAYQLALDDPDPSSPAVLAVLERREIYEFLDLRLIPDFRSKVVHHLASGGASSIVFAALFYGIAATMTAVSGGCIPVYQPTFFLYVLFLYVIDLANMAASNSQADTFAALHLSALGRIRGMLLRRPAGDPVAARLAQHAEVLKGFAEDASRARARLFGVAVDGAIVRTFAVTVFTVLVGLWTVVRSAGVVFTMDVACASR